MCLNTPKFLCYSSCSSLSLCLSLSESWQLSSNIEVSLARNWQILGMLLLCYGYEKGYTIIIKKNRGNWYLEPVHWVAARAMVHLLCAGKSSMQRIKREVTVGAEEKGILMASFDSWQDSGLTPSLPLMGGRDPGGTFVQAIGLWHFREKWNYESNLGEHSVCVCCL